ncbi:MAG: DUF2339 domain-containing protein [Paludibacteraceae bacterium]|nr:DUF2339 domain-containing protein [Paludibacteraceae bacterium]
METFLIIIAIIIATVVIQSKLAGFTIRFQRLMEVEEENRRMIKKLGEMVAQLKAGTPPAGINRTEVNVKERQTTQMTPVTERVEPIKRTETVEPTPKAETVEKINTVERTIPQNEEVKAPEGIKQTSPEPKAEPISVQTGTPKDTVPGQTQQTVEGNIKTEQPIAKASVSPQSSITKNKPFDLGKPISAATQKKEGKEKKTNYEQFIGENLFGKIGILIFVIGIGFFVKYAIDKNWINETMRTVLGFGIGAGLFAIGHKLREKYRTFSSLLVGGCFAVFFLTDVIAYHYYGLYTQPVAFTILLVTMLLMVTLSILYDRRELAIIALIGGFLAPFIVRGSDGNVAGLLTYILVLNIGMFALSMYKKWSELPIISFGATTIISILLIANVSGHETTMVLFFSIFYLVFQLPIFQILRGQESGKMNTALTSTILSNNITYFSLGQFLLSQMDADQLYDWAIHPSALLCIFTALVNLGIHIWMRKAGHKFLKEFTLALIIIFITLFVPIQFDGKVVFLTWAAEMVLSYWLFTHSKARSYEFGALGLLLVTIICFVLCIMDTDYHSIPTRLFANQYFVSNIFTSIAYLAMALLMEKYKDISTQSQLLNYKLFNPFLYISAVLTAYISTCVELSVSIESSALSAASIGLFTSAMILLICFCFRHRFSYEKHAGCYVAMMGLPVLSFPLSISFAELPTDSLPFVFLLINGIVGALCLYLVAKDFYKRKPSDKSFTIYLNILAMTQIVTMVYLIATQMGCGNFSIVFSITMGVIGFIQMCLGMKLHMKIMRIISLCTFGLVLGKLIAVDLWSMPSLGKIITFVLLGLLLLTLSFLYQKLKNVLFQDETEEKVEDQQA